MNVKFKSETDSLVGLDHPISMDSVLTHRFVPVLGIDAYTWNIVSDITKIRSMKYYKTILKYKTQKLDSYVISCINGDY